MKGKLFLIHWHEGEAGELAARLGAAGWEVAYEAEDGGRAYKKVKADPPDIIVCSLARLPSHGRRTVAYIKESKAAPHIPVIFTGGEREALEKTRAQVPEAEYIREGELMAALERFSGGE